MLQNKHKEASMRENVSADIYDLTPVGYWSLMQLPLSKALG